jgi:hypothetical protein
MVDHDTGKTVEMISRHIGSLLNLKLRVALYSEVEVFSAEEHDCLRSGDPVAVVMIDNTVAIYPWIIERTEHVLVECAAPNWAVDVMVDDSDSSVGMCGYEPVKHSTHHNLGNAIKAVAKILVDLHIDNSLEAEDEAQRAEEYNDA